MATRVIAIDPGDTTGYAYGVLVNGQLHTETSGEMEWLEFCEWLHEHLTRRYFDQVVVESWRLRPGRGPALGGSSLVPVQCIGAIRLACALTRTPLHPQEPAVKEVADRMHGGTAYLPKGSTHAKDAVRHLHYYTTTHKGELS